MSRQIRFALLTTAAAFCLCTAAFSQDSSPSASADKNFVMHADEGNTAEITASQIALKKSKNPEVKIYAQQMISDHMKLRTDMKPLADKLGVMTPQPLNPTHKVESQRLSQLSGAKFDAEYIKAMDQDHHKTLGMFQNEVATTSNDELKTAVQGAIPVIQGHTDMADQMATKMNIPTATTPPAGTK